MQKRTYMYTLKQLHQTRTYYQELSDFYDFFIFVKSICSRRYYFESWKRSNEWICYFL